MRKIEKLEAENSRLTVELNHWRDQAIKESELKGHAEEEANELRPALQAAQADIQQMQQTINDWAQIADHLSHSLLVTIWEGENRTTISIFGGIGTKEAISLQAPGARPVATW